MSGLANGPTRPEVERFIPQLREMMAEATARRTANLSEATVPKPVSTRKSNPKGPSSNTLSAQSSAIRKALVEIMSPVAGAPETTIPAGGDPPGGYRKRNYLGFEIPPTPQWVVNELHVLKLEYRYDVFTRVFTARVFDAETGKELVRERQLQYLKWRRNMTCDWRLSIMCLDCRGKYFKTGSEDDPDEKSLAILRVHVKSEGHRKNVERRVEGVRVIEGN